MRTVVPLRHSESPTHTMTLVARDNGTIPNEVNTQIIVNVLQNPNQQQQPYFSTSFYNVTVPENSPTGEILRVRVIFACKYVCVDKTVLQVKRKTL